MAQDPSLSEARVFCRGLLPRVSRTFAINIELLPGTLREPVRLAYLLCRGADTLEDSWPGTPAEIVERFAVYRAALNGDRHAASHLGALAFPAPPGRPDLELLANLPRLLEVLEAQPAPDREALLRGVGIMVAGMSRYASRAAQRGPGVSYLDDDDELHDYCWVVAGCVGAMMTELFEQHTGPESAELRARRRALAPVVGEALQLTNILLDWPGDLARGRCYLPANWLARFGLTPALLAEGSPPAARELALRLEGLAHAALDRVPDYLDTLPPRHLRYRLFCLWPALWARASLRLAHRDPRFPLGGSRPRLTRAALWTSAARSLLIAYDHRRVRRMLTGTASLPPA